MKISKQFISGFLSASLIITGTIGTFAATPTGLKAIQAYLNQSKIMYHGQAVKDAKNVAYNSLTYNGSEYIPLSVVEKAGIPVNRGTDKNLYIDSTESEFKVNSSKFIMKSDSEYMLFTKSPKDLFIDGTQYKYGFITSTASQSYYLASFKSLDGDNDYAPHSLTTEYTSNATISTMEATFYLNKNATLTGAPIGEKGTITRDLTLIGYTKDSDGVTVVLSVPIQAGVPQKLSIPMDSKNISFKISPSQADNLTAFADLKLYILDPIFVK